VLKLNASSLSTDEGRNLAVDEVVWQLCLAICLGRSCIAIELSSLEHPRPWEFHDEKEKYRRLLKLRSSYWKGQYPPGFPVALPNEIIMSPEQGSQKSACDIHSSIIDTQPCFCTDRLWTTALGQFRNHQREHRFDRFDSGGHVLLDEMTIE
jgi:hypothetical protein